MFVKIIQLLFLYKIPCNLLRDELGVEVLLADECANYQMNSAKYNCPAYLTCGAAGSCSSRPIVPAMNELAIINRGVHNSNMDSEQELDDLDEHLDDLLDRIRRDGEECGSSPCGGNGDCVEGLSAYSCTCEPSWGGPNCRDQQDTISLVNGFVDYSNQDIDCFVYSQYEFWSMDDRNDRVWDDGTAAGREQSYYTSYPDNLRYPVGPANADEEWPYSASIQPAQPDSVIVSRPRQDGSVCPLMVTRVDKTSANRLTTLTEFLKLEENRGHEDAMAAIRRGFHLDRGIDYYDHRALYGADADCEQTRNVFRAFLKMDLLVESAVALSTEALAAETQAYYEIADLVSDGNLDLTGSDGANSITQILIISGVPQDSATVAAEYLVQKCREIESLDVCNPAKFTQIAASRADVLQFFDVFTDGNEQRPCDASPCQNGGSCANVIKLETLVYRCDCFGNWIGRDCSEEAVVLTPQGQDHYTIEGTAYDSIPYENCEVYLDLNNNGVLDVLTEGGLVAMTSRARRADLGGGYSITVDSSVELRADSIVRMIPRGEVSEARDAELRNLCPPLATRADACAMTSMTTIALLVDDFGDAEGRSRSRSQAALNDVLNLDDGADVYGMWFPLDDDGSPIEPVCDRGDCTEFSCTVHESFCGRNPEGPCDSLCDAMLRIGLQFSILYQFAAEVSRPQSLAQTLPSLLTEVAAAANERQLDLDDAQQVYDLLLQVAGDQGCQDQPGGETVQCSATRLGVISKYVAGQSRSMQVARISSIADCATQQHAIISAVTVYQQDADVCMVGVPYATGDARFPCRGECQDLISTDPSARNCVCPQGFSGENCDVAIALPCDDNLVTDCVVTGQVTGTIFGMGCTDPGGSIDDPTSVTCAATSPYAGCKVFVDLNGNGFLDGDEPVGDVVGDVYTITLQAGVTPQYDTHVYLTDIGALDPGNAAGTCSQRLVTQAAGSQMNTLTTLVAKQPTSERAIASRFGYAADYTVFTAPVGACAFDTSDDCMRVEIAARQLDVLVAGALSQRSKVWGTREDTEYRLYEYMSNLAASSGYWLTKPEGVQDILMSIGAESDSALAIGT
eukprot:COSAG02_NODE_6942_length_3274_cov_4.341417_1_plen_1080_part_01